MEYKGQIEERAEKFSQIGGKHLFAAGVLSGGKFDGEPYIVLSGKVEGKWTIVGVHLHIDQFEGKGEEP